ncbi:MAG: peptidyl-prolyl cis-trans isomerase [Chromatiales bacterium]|nr:MAG: peptidyl-prolyl cis-trans isomerase [Chromatiales bacterium]
MTNLFKEPLVHFLVVGALLFGVYSWMNPGAGTADDRVIEITPGTVQRLQDAWARQWRRPPTQQELDGLIEDHIREEVLYREAIALGLERDDTIIRRRLAQKMEFLSEDIGTLVEPSDVELREFFAERQADFAEPARVSFTHVYFSPDQRGPRGATDAELVLAELQAADITDASERGDRFLMQLRYDALTERDAAQLFGSNFAERLFALPVGGWQGPVESGFGWHLVRVTERVAPRMPDFEVVRDEVRREFDYERQREARAATYEALRARYEIVFSDDAENAG